MAQVESSPLTANEELAKAIADGLIELNLISKDKHSTLLAGLAKGTITQSDWRLLLEIAAEKGGKA